MPTSSPSTLPAQRRLRWRWAALLAGSVLLHLLLLDWADGHWSSPAAVPAATMAAPIAVVLRPAPAPAPVAAAKTIPPPKAKTKTVPPATPAPSVVTDIAAIGATEAMPASPEPASVETPFASTVDAPIAPEPMAVMASPADAPTDAPTETPPPTRYTVRPPPSATLSYDVSALRDGQKWYGSGEIKWQTDGRDYLVTGTAGVSALLFRITALHFASQGQMDDFGVAPLLYTETRFRKSATNTHFRQDPDIISFSASTTNYPRPAGAQDRASVMWQLAAIGNGDPGQFVPGAEIDVFVAGVRDAETWRIQVIDLEQITVGTGTLSAWHVSRAPRAGSYEQKIDIWLSPGHHWYPVKIRYTEANSDTLDLSLSRLDGATEH